ncbi:MAG: response regulator [Bdellovibrionaceae bacterium]|nr:response regulator [Pseudobdellovibrionaceae bacterium]
MQLKKFTQLRLFLLGISVLFVICINSWLLYNSFREVDERENLVIHTHEVISTLDLILSSVKDAESGLRGYLLTDDSDYLKFYEKGRLDAYDYLNRVKALIDDNASQGISIGIVKQTLNTRFEILQSAFDIYKNQTRNIKTVVSRFSNGKAVMDNLREQITKMKDVENDLLKTRNLDSKASKKFFFWSLNVTTILSILVIAFAFYQISRNQMKTSLDAEEKEKTAKVAQIMSGDVTLELAAKNILEFLSREFNVLAGRLFMLDQGTLRPVVAYGIKDESVFSQQNETNLLQAALTRTETWEINEVPENYWRVSSSLGESIPKTLTLMPFSFQNRPMGVFELASFERLSKYQKSLLTKLNPVLGIGLNAAQSRTQMQALLERTQLQSEELQTQQEELKSNNEELEQQARALESQQQALSIKNKELEVTQLDLQSKAVQLERSSQYKSDFLAKMSHELRTPLNGLLILSTLLVENREQNMTDQQRGFARSIYNAGNDLLVLINDILDLSKIEARKLKLRPDDFTVGSLFDSKRLTFEPQTSTKNLKFNIEISDEMRILRLHTDRQRLEQILRNFLSNAIKFTDKGSITLKAELDSKRKWIIFSVTDTGIGIPKDKQKVIFEAFEQADSSVSRQYGGTGLGLTISRELAALLGGTIDLKSEVGQGSQFNLKIPIVLDLAKNEASAFEIKTPAIAPSIHEVEISPASEVQTDRVRKGVQVALQNVDAKRKTILVVEDDETFRSSIVEMIRSYDFEAVEANDGEIALAILNEHTPDAILLDIKLPGISGLGILELIKHLPHLRHVPVHMISALEYQHNALRMGALGYLTKPVTIEKVKSALGRIKNMISNNLRRVLLIEDDERQSKAISELISGDEIEVISARTGKEAMDQLKQTAFDCIILDLTLPDISGIEVLSELSKLEISVPPVVIYTGKDLSDSEEESLRKYSESIVIKGARSPERLLDEVNLFLHRVESLMPMDKREMLSQMRSQVKSFEGKTILVVDDDIRNVFALTSALEAKGLQVRVARNGIEALDSLDRHPDIDLILMDIMMPKMDGFEAMRRIRQSQDQRVRHIPVVALTAKAMREDHEKCMEAGASDYLPKPVNLNNLTTVLKVWLTPKGFLA